MFAILDQERQTGRTSRILTHALAEVRAGRRVIFIIHSAEILRYIQHLLHEIEPEIRFPHPWFAKLKTGTLQIETVEKVREGSLRGLNYPLYIDHYVNEFLSRSWRVRDDFYQQLWPRASKLRSPL